MSDSDWLEEAYYKLSKMPKEAMEVRERAINDLYYFACLMNNGYCYGNIHKQTYEWLQQYTLFTGSEDLTCNKLILFPRAHLKSHMVATTCAWLITRHPEITILYTSATAELAIMQLYDIKNILNSPIYRRYFPEYIHPQEGLREKWSSKAIIIDHPKRKKEGIRDDTVKIAGITTNTTGWHADVIVADDLVVPENAYTEEGRNSVAKKVSQFTSIRNAGGFTLACGTRYHPKDIYDSWKEQEYEVYDDEGLLVEKKKVWDIVEKVVETEGFFLWPRTVRPDGKAFGFNMNILARIKAEYADDVVQYYAQYYNNPNESSSYKITEEKFQYYNPKFMKFQYDGLYYRDRKLNVFASVDFAFSLNKKADYTAIVVIGMDYEKNIYVLDISRFKTEKISEYFKEIKTLHIKWNFKKLRAEVTVAQKAIVSSIKDSIREAGLRISIEEFCPNRYQGSKEERMIATLEPKYNDLKMWHYQGGFTQVLEEELKEARPKHDDIKDALASAVDIATPPQKPRNRVGNEEMTSNVIYNKRFGGVAR